MFLKMSEYVMATVKTHGMMFASFWSYHVRLTWLHACSEEKLLQACLSPPL